MKTAILVLSLLSASELVATEPKFDDIAYPFIVSTNCQIEWRDSATLPFSTASVYRVGPTEFSPTMISNLVSFLGFSWDDRDPKPSSPCGDLGGPYFRNQKRYSPVDD